jgi:general secretion pathway protein L
MGVVAIWTAWIEVIASLLARRDETRRARHTATLTRRDGALVAIGPNQPRSSATVLAPGSAVPAALSQAARNGLIVYELLADEVVRRLISVPTKAREFLPGIVTNQIERLSPWPASESVHGFHAAPGSDEGNLDVEVLITSRSVLESARQELAAFGLTTDRVVARRPGDETPVLVWSRRADASKAELAGTCRRLGLAVISLVVVSFGVSAWALVSAWSIAGDTEDAMGRISTLQRGLQAPRLAAQLASLGPPQRAWALKQTSPVAVVVLEALSLALPDTAYLTELQLEHGTLRITGLADDAPSLLAPLQRSGHLADVHFFAPTTRSPEGSRFVFHIEARVEPRIRVKGE